jgi:hypothetical protein
MIRYLLSDQWDAEYLREITVTEINPPNYFKNEIEAYENENFIIYFIHHSAFYPFRSVYGKGIQNNRPIQQESHPDRDKEYRK